MDIKATKYTPTAPALDSLKETYIYQVADKIARHVRPTRQEIAYITATIRRQRISPTGLLLRGWLFDFTSIAAPRNNNQLSIF